MKKFNTVLLIDDDEVDNIAHSRLIMKTDFASNILIEHSPIRALELLKFQYENSEKCADIIFLDINMPIMNGFVFLKSLLLLPPDFIKNTTIVLLSSSLDPLDVASAGNNPLVYKFFTKPLKKEMLLECCKDFLT